MNSQYLGRRLEKAAIPRGNIELEGMLKNIPVREKYGIGKFFCARG